MRFFRAVAALWSFESWFVLFLNAGRLKALALEEGVELPIDLTLVFFAVCALIASVRIAWRAHRRFDGPRFLANLFTGLFFVWGVASWLWSPQTERALHLTMLYASVLPGAYFFAAAIIATDDRRVRRFFAILTVWALVIAVASTYTYLQGGGLKFVFGSSYLAFARVLGMAVLILLGYALRPRIGCSHRMGLVLIAFVCIAPMYLLGGRAPLLGVALALGVGSLGAVRLRGTRVHFRPALLSLALVLVVAVGTFAILAVSGTPIRAVIRVVSLFDQSQQDNSARIRELLWRKSYEVWQDEPLVGHGLGGFQVEASTPDGLEYPHSLPLELLTEMGVVGLALFGLAFVIALYVFRMRRDETPLDLYDAIRMLTVYWAFNQLVGGSMENSAWAFAIMGLLPRAPALVRHHRLRTAVGDEAIRSQGSEEGSQRSVGTP